MVYVRTLCVHSLILHNCTPQDPEPNTQAKYMAECRGLFGVMYKVDPVTGEKTGHRMQPFNYTGKKVIGPANFQKRFWAEVERVNNLKTTGTSSSKYWKQRGLGLTGGAYQAKYGARRWKGKVVEHLGKGSDAVCCVTALMDHCIKEGRRLFRGTPYYNNFIIYHDALSAWWSVGAQDHMRTRRFEHRQIRGLGLTNCGTR